MLQFSFIELRSTDGEVDEPDNDLLYLKLGRLNKAKNKLHARLDREFMVNLSLYD